MNFNLPVAKEDEVYAAREIIDLGSGPETVTVIYPKNKIIPRYLVDEALRELEESEVNHSEGAE